MQSNDDPVGPWPIDAIDFRCSPLWLNYYHAYGLTPRSAPEPQLPGPDVKQPDYDTEPRVERLERELAEVRIAHAQFAKWVRAKLNQVPTELPPATPPKRGGVM